MVALPLPTLDPRTASGKATSVPLCVDLDGTLVRGDLLVEALAALLTSDLPAALQAPLWLLRGTACFKAEVARRVSLDIASLPYNAQLLNYLQAQRDAGRRLVLATAAPAGLARQVADYLGLFHEVLASNERTNLKGAWKADALVARFGERGFDYAGDGYADLAVWRHCRRAIVVDPAPGVSRALRSVAELETLIENEPAEARDYVQALRLHQWAKNVLVFVPLLAAHRAGDIPLLLQAVIAFFAFSLCASSVYVFNDLLDLPADRAHPRKCTRPLAAGTIPIVYRHYVAAAHFKKSVG